MPVFGATATEAQADDVARNPALTANRQVVHCTLVFEGVTADASDIYDALNAQYGTVGSEKNTVGRGTYVFNIKP